MEKIMGYKSTILKMLFALIGVSCIVVNFFWDRKLYSGSFEGVYCLISDIIIAVIILLSVFLIFRWIDKKKEPIEINGRFLGNTYKILPVILFVFAILLRVVQFGMLPKAMMCDEQSMLYDAWCLANYGVDRNGHRWPVYLEAWGSGQSALLAYLTIPFVLLFGMNVLSARLAMLTTSLLAIVFFYFLTKKIKNKNIAIIALFIFAISPFHIMMSRWGLDCNLLINLLIIALYYLITSFEEKKSWFFVLACFIFGLCLYAYALSYLLLILMLFMTYMYMLYMKKIKWIPFILGNLLLGCMALPLVLFLMVNAGWIDPITTVLFSIPRLSAYRVGEIRFSWRNLYQILLFFAELDKDFRASTTIFGSLYHIGTLFFIIGTFKSFKESIKKFKNKQFDFSIFIIFLFIANMLEAIVITMNFYKWNAMFIPYFFMIAIGLNEVLKYSSKLFYVFSTGLLILSIIFFTYYATFYNYKTDYVYDAGMIESVLFIEEINEGNLPVEVYSSWEGGINTMIALQIPIDTLLSNIEYEYDINNWRKVVQIKNYHYHSICKNYKCETISIEPEVGKIYVLKDGKCNACHTQLNFTNVFDETWKTKTFYDFIVFYQ